LIGDSEVERKGYTNVLAISNILGKGYLMRDMTDSLLQVLEDLFDSEWSLFPPDINSKEDVRAWYQAFRSYRCSSDTTRAI
jgi:hypothetical protein